MFNTSESCGCILSPCRNVGRLLCVLEEGVQRLESGGTVRDEAAIEVHQPNKFSQLALYSRKGKLPNHLNFLL